MPAQMLDKIREHGGSWGVKLGAGAIVLVFIFFGYGSQSMTDRTDFAAKVNGRKISVEDFERAFQFQQQQMQGNPNLPDDLQDRFVAQRALDQLVERELLLQFADEVGIHVSKREVADNIKKEPDLIDPKTGEFVGKAKYLAFLDELQMDVAQFEQGVARSLRIEKAREYLTAAARVTPAELQEEFRARQEKVNLSFVEVDAIALADSLKSVSISKAEIDAWTAAHPGEVESTYAERKDTRYTTPAKVELFQITVRKPIASKPGEKPDASAAKAKAEKALEAAKADWKKAAEEFSQGAPWEKTGQPREFAQRDLVAAVADTVFQMKPADPAQLIETPTSFVIAKVKSTSPEKVTELDESLKKAIVEEKIRQEKAAAEVDKFAKEAHERLKKGESLEKIAASKNLAVKETGSFPRREEIPGLPDADPVLVAEVFTLEKPGEVLGKDGPPRVGNGYVLAVLKEHVQPTPEDFEKQKGWLEMGLKRNKGQLVFNAWKAARIAESKIIENPRIVPNA